MWIMDFGNDDDFSTARRSNITVKNPWYEVVFDKEKAFNTIVITEGEKPNITKYKLQYRTMGEWTTIFSGENIKKIKIHRFARVYGDRVKIVIDEFKNPAEIAEFGVFNERR